MKIFKAIFAFIFICKITLIFGQDFSCEPFITIPGDNYDIDVLSSDDYNGIDESYISWVNKVDSTYTIYMKKISPNISSDIIVSSDSIKKSNPQISYGKIAWQDSSNGIWKVWLKKYHNDTLSTKTLLIDSQRNDPQITMSTYRIAWIDSGILKIQEFYNDIEKSEIIDSINCSSPDLLKGDYLEYTKIVYEKCFIDKKEIYIAEPNIPNWNIYNISICETNINPKFGFMESVAYQGYKNGFWNIYYEDFTRYPMLDSIQISGYNLRNPMVFSYTVPCSDHNIYTPYFVVFEKDSSLENESEIFLYTFGYIMEDSFVQVSDIQGKNSEPEVAYLIESDTIKVAIIWINENNGKKDIWLAKSIFIPFISAIKENKNQDNPFSLKQNYPNPFNPETIIEYYIAKPGKTSITIYNVLGEIIEIFDKGFQDIGIYQIKFNGRKHPSGVYYYKIKSVNFSETRSMLLIK